MPTREELKIKQGLPLDIKIRLTEQRIREWVNHFGVDGLWKPTREGLGMAHVIDDLNARYGKDFIRY